MADHIVKILAVEDITHDVKRLVVEKPDGYEFEPGQATEVAINKEDWKDEKRPFTFTSLNNDPNLEFTIKIYDDHDGVTKQIGKLDRGDELILGDAWGTIQYKGPGYFIAGGAGVTPFISIFRQLEKEDKLDGNSLMFSNKTEKDIILNGEFTRMLGPQFINTLSDEDTDGIHHGIIDKDYLQEIISDFDQNFYVCGPPQMVDDIKKQLKELGADSEGVVFEK